MKKLSVAVISVLSALVFNACADDSSVDAVKSANESNEVKLDSANNHGDTRAASDVTVDVADSKFAVEAASGGMTEVQLGELAQQKAASQRVKDFGAMMVRDHSKANDELKSLGGMKNLTLPPAPGEHHMKMIKDLTKKSGKEFDRDYMDAMVNDHQDDIAAFEKIQNNGKDPDLKAFAAKTLPVLRMHLDSAKAIHKTIK